MAKETRKSIVHTSQVQFELPRQTYWRRQVECQFACPVHTDARGYIRAIAAGDDEMAYLIARGPNPLASICGRVCGAPCETECRRGKIDKPVAIRALKRYVCSQFGPEARPDGPAGLIGFLKDAARRHAPRPIETEEELLPLLQAHLNGEVTPANGESVAVVGSGPAGLACAHDLALLGFSVTLYELEPVLGGMLAVGVPEYRLPREVIAAEAAVIEALGVAAVTSCEVGKDVSLPELRAKHKAVVIAVGLKRSRSLDIPGGDATGVLGGVEFLRDVSLGRSPQLGSRVVVIGGGSVAFDVGRTALRQTSVDAARTALRGAGVAEVHLCSLESLGEMPAEDFEIIEGDEEGILRRNSVGPREILTDDGGSVTGVVLRRCLRVFDDGGRFSPLFDDDDTQTIECDNVLLAVGQAVDLSFVDAERDGLEVTRRGFVACDPDTGATNAPDVFISGDLAYGPKLLIHAVASGKRVARAVYETITGRKITHRATELHLSIVDYQREVGYEEQRRVVLRTAPVAERVQSQSTPVEYDLTEEESRCEAGRCLDCGVNTIFDGDKCILCGGCVDVCPEMCLRIVSADRLAADGEAAEVLELQLGGIPADGASAILKDETRCIRCALCANRCPSGAITMERFHLKEAPVCQTV